MAIVKKLTHNITAIKASKNPQIQRSNIYLDGKFAFSLDNEVILKKTLKIGQPLSEQQLAQLNGTDSQLRCLNAAYQFLEVRPRSRSEMSLRLTKRGFTEPDIESTLSKLEELHLLDDQAFAEYWKENRTAFRPRSRNMLKQELRGKGVASEVINTALGELDESANAYQAAVTKSRSLRETDYRIFRQKLSGFLLRRGFGYGVIKNTVKRVWEEKTGQSATQFDTREETGTTPD
jgi:regulatory protein